MKTISSLLNKGSNRARNFKSASRFALVRFWNYSFDYPLNCTPPDPITITKHWSYCWPVKPFCVPNPDNTDKVYYVKNNDVLSGIVLLELRSPRLSKYLLSQDNRFRCIKKREVTLWSINMLFKEWVIGAAADHDGINNESNLRVRYPCILDV